ncbi:sulfite exporter TauE/SafE family protein [Streptomyces alboflavus]|uniref:sulfite exporter TauE/SafE family protein n=1 Tax=Streptomyces alboflavus TaxID=67267 RepID=UPI000527F24D
MSTLVLALVAGAVVGLALGALGGGGSMLAVPALIYLLGFTPAAATTASLLIVAVTSATALYAHARSGQVRWRSGTLFAATGILPAAGAGAAAGRLPQAVLTAAFAGVAGVAGVLMVRVGGRGDGAGREGGPESVDEAVGEGGPGRVGGAGCGGGAGLAGGPEDVGGAVREGGPGREAGAGRAGRPEGVDAGAPDGGARRAGGSGDRGGRAGLDSRTGARAARPGRAAGAGAGLGALTGLLGVGGGFLVVPALVTVLAFEMRAATGTSLLVIAVNSLASLITRGSTTTGLDWAVVAPFTGAAVLGAWDGKRLAARLTGAALRRTFAVALLVVAAAMAVDAVVQSAGRG